ncbi:hypothetical protein O0L34_g14752 [Tuta absoluta]|nr:hypothetical protein O0L34_g14752 [Tuta absoluta]
MHFMTGDYLRLDGVAGAAPTVETAAPPQNDGPLSSDLDGFVDDEGSGLEVDESSGSGWGPGPDDEDSRGGSGDGGDPTRTDDEDYYIPAPKPTSPAPQPDDDASDNDGEPDIIVDSGEDVESDNASTQAPFPPFDVDPRVISGKNLPIEEIDEPKKSPGLDTSPDHSDDILLPGEENISGIDDGTEHVGAESRPADNVVVVMNAKPEDRATSFFAQPGILAAVIGGAVVGLLCAILVVMFIVYRMRKKDEGSYALDEPKRSPAAASYGKGHNNREFYA